MTNVTHTICYVFILTLYMFRLGPGVPKWLRRCATSRTVPGSIPDGVTGFFSDIFPSDRTMALGSTQPLVKMSTRNIPVSKGGRCVRLTTSPPLRAECHEIWEPKSPGTLWATQGLLRYSFTFTCFEHIVLIIRRDKLYQYNLWYMSLCIGDRVVCRSEVSSRQSDRYQRLYWYNLSLLMMSTMCSKHVES
jgi:hypothetical protein